MANNSNSSIRFWENLQLANLLFDFILPLGRATDYGHPERVFFKHPKLLGLGRQVGQINFGTFGVFSVRFNSTHFGTVNKGFTISINLPLFRQKTKPLYPNRKFLFRIGI